MNALLLRGVEPLEHGPKSAKQCVQIECGLGVLLVERSAVGQFM